MKTSEILRDYVVQTSIGNSCTEFLQPSLHDILTGDDEVSYSLQEVINDVLDLKKHESMYFQPNRDNKNSKAIITRVR